MCQFLYELERVIRERVESRSESSYTYKLFSQGLDRICKKVLEESGEVVIAAMRESRERVIQEIADLIYHVMVLMRFVNVSIDDVCRELERRHAEMARARR